jgi:hypothetical protein
MRIKSILAALAVLSVLSVNAAEAQRSAQTTAQLRVTTAPAQRFRARAASERALTARHLIGDMRITISEEHLNAPFSLTPRNPDINGRGWIGVRQLRYWHARVPPELANQTWAGDAGVVEITGSYGQLTVHLANAQGRRFLLDCTVDGATQVTARTSSGAIVNFTVQNGALISLVTASSDDAVEISASNTWRFLGCEITRLQ